MSGKKASLSEVMGKVGADLSREKGKLSLKELPEILGEGTPEIDLSPVGRIRLIRSLRQRFGDNFRSLPGIKGIIEDFDSRADLEVTVQKLRAIKPGK